METFLKDFDALSAEIILRSLITSSFNNEDRFDWIPDIGLRVSIPNKHGFVAFGRAPESEIRRNILQTDALAQPKLAWWFAQLIHYGLPLAKNMNHAQESLKLAISEHRLEVPCRLIELETRLKRLYVVTPAKGGTAVTGRQSRPSTSNITNATVELKNPREHMSDPISVQGSIAGQHRNVARQRSKSVQPNVRPNEFNLDHSSDSESSSSSESNHDATPKPGHLYTPKGTRVIKPAEYPGLRENEEASKHIDKKAQKHQDLKKVKVAKEVDQSGGNKKMPETDWAESSSDSEDGRASSRQLRDNFLAYKSGLRRMNRDKIEHSRLNTSTEHDQWDIESSSDNESVATVYYTPMKIYHQRVNIADDDTASVIYSGSTKKLNAAVKSEKIAQKSSRKSSIIKKTDVNGSNKNDAKGNKSRAADSKRKSSTQKQKVKVDKISNKSKDAAVVTKEAKPRSKRSKEIQKVIEISSGSEDSCEESDESADAPKQQLRRQVKTSHKSRSEKTHSRDDSTADTDTRKLVTVSAKNRSATGLVDKSLSIEKNPQPDQAQVKARKKKPEKAVSKKPQKASHTNKTVETEGQVAAEKGAEPKKKEQKSNRERRNSENPAQTRLLPKTNLEKVRDYTGCGITEISGALHSDDEGMLPLIASFDDLVSTAAHKEPDLPRTSSHRSRLPSPTTETSDSDLGSLRELFSSQNTPKQWKTSNKSTSERNKQRDTRKSCDPDFVSAPRENFEAIPNYLKLSARHGSPELSQNPSAPQRARNTTPYGGETQERGRSRSHSLATVQRKRDRTTMMDIESLDDRSSKHKRPRLTPSRVVTAQALRGSDGISPEDVSVKRVSSTIVNDENPPRTERREKSSRKRAKSVGSQRRRAGF